MVIFHSFLYVYQRVQPEHNRSASDRRRDRLKGTSYEFWAYNKGHYPPEVHTCLKKTHTHTYIYIHTVYIYNIYIYCFYDMYIIMRSTSILASWNGPWASPSQGSRLTISLVKGNDLGLGWRWWRQTNMIIVILFSVNLSCRCWLTQYHCGYWHFDNAWYFSLHSFMF